MAAPVFTTSTSTSTSPPSQPPQTQTHRILVLPGDHVGPEVMTEALKVLDVLSAKRPHIQFKFTHEIAGGISMDQRGTPITDEVLRIAREDVDAVLFGSVGGPEWGHTHPNPESALLRLRSHISAFANIRPATFYSKSLIPRSPLKPEIASPVNFVVLRENCGGAYYGAKIEGDGSGGDDEYAVDPWGYSAGEIVRCARVAGALARKMGADGLGLGNSPAARVWSADKANVLASSRLWRRVVSRVFAEEFPDVELRHQLADSLSMIMMTDPARFNGVILTDNTFGDMLSDQAGGVVGTLGVLPSASLCGVPGEGVRCNGIYEPVHGSAPDISGTGKANPVAEILSVALLLRYSLALDGEAVCIERAVEKVLDGKDIGGLEVRGGDLGGTATTVEIGDAVCKVLGEMLDAGGVGAGGEVKTGTGSGYGLGLANDAASATPTDAHADENKKFEAALRQSDAETGPQTAIATS